MLDYVERETTVATKRVQDAERASVQEQKDISNDEKVGWTIRKPAT